MEIIWIPFIMLLSTGVHTGMLSDEWSALGQKSGLASTQQQVAMLPGVTDRDASQDEAAMVRELHADDMQGNYNWMHFTKKVWQLIYNSFLIILDQDYIIRLFENPSIADRI